MGSWRLERASYEDAEPVYGLLVDAFFPEVPALRRLFAKFGPPSLELCLGVHALSQRRSFKAVVGQGAKQRIVGAALNLNPETLPSWQPPDIEPLTTLFDFFSYVDEKSNGDEEDWLTLQVLTVHPDWRRQGIAEALVQATEDEAVNKGYRGCRVLCLSHYSALLMERRGWKEVYRLPYARYHNLIFCSEPPHLDCTVYVYRNKHYKGPETPRIISQS